MPVELHIICHRPGMFRAGVAHPRHASYPLDTFEPAALAELLHEPQLTLIRGELMADVLAGHKVPPADPDAPPASTPGRTRKGA